MRTDLNEQFEGNIIPNTIYAKIPGDTSDSMFKSSVQAICNKTERGNKVIKALVGSTGGSD